MESASQASSPGNKFSRIPTAAAPVGCSPSPAGGHRTIGRGIPQLAANASNATSSSVGSRIPSPAHARRGAGMQPVGGRSILSNSPAVKPSPVPKLVLPLKASDSSPAAVKAQDTEGGSLTPPTKATSPIVRASADHIGHVGSQPAGRLRVTSSQDMSKVLRSSGSNPRGASAASINGSPNPHRRSLGSKPVPNRTSLGMSPAAHRSADLHSSPAGNKSSGARDTGSPSPGVPRKTISRTSAGTSAPRTSVNGRLGNEPAAAPYVGNETRSSMLRRSASVDKMRTSLGSAPRVSTAPGLGYHAAAPTAATRLQPQPPAQPRPSSASRIRPQQHGRVGTGVSPARGRTPDRPHQTSNLGGMIKPGGGGLLSAIPEHKGAGPAAAAAPVNKPGFKLNLAAVNRQPTSSSAEQPAPSSATSSGPAPAPPVAPVPKLNLTTVLQEQEQPAGPAYVVPPGDDDSNDQGPGSAAGPKASTKSSAGGHKKASAPPEPAPDHFYFYPKMDPKDERRMLEALQRLPKTQQKQWKKIYDEMVEAKQNCEAIAYRGHRLLDQLQAHHKDTIETKEKRMQNEILRYQQEAEEAKLELERMRAALSQTRGGSVSEFSDTISGLTVRLPIPPPGYGQDELGSHRSSQGCNFSGRADHEAAPDMEHLLQQLEQAGMASMRQANVLTDQMRSSYLGSVQLALPQKVHIEEARGDTTVLDQN